MTDDITKDLSDSEKLDFLINTVSDIRQRQLALEELVHARLHDTRPLWEGVQQRLDRLEQRLAGLEQRLASLEQRLASLEQRLEGLEQRLAGLEQRLAGLEQRLEGLEQRFDGMQQQLDSLRAEQREEFAQVQQKLRMLEKMVGAVHHDNLELLAEVRILEDRVAALERAA